MCIYNDKFQFLIHGTTDSVHSTFVCSLKSSPPPELELLAHTGSVNPQETKTLSSKHAQLDIKMEVAAGNLSQYPGNDDVFIYYILNVTL